MLGLQRRASAGGLSQQTLIIAIVCAAVGGLVLLAILFRTIRSCRSRRNAAPLPPIQPLAHQREHQLAQFEASLQPHRYDPSFLAAPHPPYSPQLGSPSARGSKTSLLGSYSSPHTSYREGSEELSNLTPPEPESPLPVPHSFLGAPTPPSSSSSTHLDDNPTTSYTNTPTTSSAPSSFSKHSKSLPKLSRDDQSRPHHHRPLSVASSLSRISSLPHGPHSQVQAIMPAPLAPGIPPTPSRQSLYEPGTPGDRMSVVDRWVSTGQESTIYSPVLQESARPPRAPRRVSSNPQNTMTTGPQFNHRQYPSMPDVGLQRTPPVPRMPSVYGQGGGKSENDKRRKLSKRVGVD